MAAFMLGWAGISVHCQTLSFLCDSGLSAKTYIIGKLIHGILSAALGMLGIQMTQMVSDCLTLICAIPIQLKVLRELSAAPSSGQI